MTTIHMETEKVRTVARKMDTDADQMLASLSQAQSSASRLRFAWQGRGAEEFNDDLNRLIKNIENHIVALQTLSVRVFRETDEWLSADSLGATMTKRQWEERLKLWPALGIWGAGGNAYTVLKKLFEDKYLKNIKGLGPGLDLIGGYFSFMDDEDPNRARAAISSTVSTYGPYGLLLIPVAGQAAFVIYETTMAVNSGIQLGAQAQVLKDELWSEANLSNPEMYPLYEEMTVTTNEFYENAERIDLENIPKDIGRAVYDYSIQPYVTAITEAYDDRSVTNLLRLGAITGSTFIGGPILGTSVAYSMDPQAQQAVQSDMRAIGVDTANVVVGVIQFPFTYLEHETAYGVAQVAATASQLPLPDSWKTGITQTSTVLVEKINNIPELYDLIGLEKQRQY